ncbi:cytochrome c oxidase assembly protein [Oleiharenicola lentus]|uniref:cytochrome c oxidase assembly protein n=1 Tax=Oleiharenicola lentus TaxID=2508720 RepID=UPI003F6660A3
MRPLPFIFGIVLLAALWCGPLPELARTYFSAHMLLHMGVVAAAAPLLSLAVIGGRFDPARRWPDWFPAIPLSLAELVIVWVWHAPALHQFARSTAAGLMLEQACFFLAGVLVWISAFGGAITGRRERAGAGLTALLLTSMHMTLLGALLALTPRVLYSHNGSLAFEDAPLTPLEDQHLGGAIMLLIGGVVYLAGGLWLTRVLLRERASHGEVAA